MAYDQERRKPMQPPEESLHWISYNLKMICKQLEMINQNLGSIPNPRSALPPKNSAPYIQRHQQEEIPF